MPEEEEEEQEIENLFEKIMEENFPNLVKEIDIQVQEAQSPKQVGPKGATPKHITIKMPKVKGKERILKAAKKEQLVSYMGVAIRLSADFSKETLQARRDWQEIFKVMESRDLQPSLLYPAKLSLRKKKRADEAENQINDLGHKEEKANQPQQEEEKKSPPKMRIV